MESETPQRKKQSEKDSVTYQAGGVTHFANDSEDSSAGQASGALSLGI